MKLDAFRRRTRPAATAEMTSRRPIIPAALRREESAVRRTRGRSEARVPPVPAPQGARVLTVGAFLWGRPWTALAGQSPSGKLPMEPAWNWRNRRASGHPAEHSCQRSRSRRAPRWPETPESMPAWEPEPDCSRASKRPVRAQAPRATSTPERQAQPARREAPEDSIKKMRQTGRRRPQKTQASAGSPAAHPLKPPTLRRTAPANSRCRPACCGSKRWRFAATMRSGCSRIGARDSDWPTLTDSSKKSGPRHPL